MTVERITAYNSTSALGGFCSPLAGFVLAQGSALRTNPDSYRDAEKTAQQ
jgi:hypothetical protein